MASLLGLPPSFSGFVLENEPMSRHTTYRIGGPARAYVRADSLRSLVDAIDACRIRGLGWFVAGRGSNLLVSDEGFEPSRNPRFTW